MKDATKILKGSPYRDAVKSWHKRLGSGFYACDLDLLLIEFSKKPILACLDSKKPPGRYLANSHKVVYDFLESYSIPVYLISPIRYSISNCPECGCKNIEIDADSDVLMTRYRDGVSLKMSLKEYVDWEKKLRRYNP